MICEICVVNRSPEFQAEAVARRMKTGTAMCMDCLAADIEFDANDSDGKTSPAAIMKDSVGPLMDCEACGAVVGFDDTEKGWAAARLLASEHNARHSE